MSVEIITYFGFVVAACILIWAVYELARRYDRKRFNTKDTNSWVSLDTTSSRDVEEPLTVSEDEDDEEHPEQSLHSRARQNGHYSESKKPS
ncbi:MAG TPA: hypothetical protein VKV40_01485 [Ktedonobacteraceae bacterium]|nr:hypothetical protein [Ktedonobacteraceae bacterium]